MTDINNLRKLLAAAPPTPWTVEERDGWWEVTAANPSARLWPAMAFDDGSACGEYSGRCLVKSRDLIVAAVNALAELLDEIEWLKSDLYHAIQALHCSAPNELMSVQEIRAWLEIRNTLSDKYKEAT